MAYNTIKIKKFIDHEEEYAAAAALYPGHLIELTSSGTVQKHSTASGNALPMFALEDELQGKGIDDVYAAGSKVKCWIPVRGEEVYAVLTDGQSVAIGDLLESTGEGTLTAYTADSESHDSFDSFGPVVSLTTYPLQIVAMALEAVDISDSSGAEDSGTLDWDKRIRVRIV